MLLVFTAELFSQNFYSDYRYSEGKEHNLFTVFSVFFPAATGILAGANISGDLEVRYVTLGNSLENCVTRNFLKDPQSAIPKGTMLAIVISTASYVGFAFICGATVLRDASGDVADLFNGTISNCTGDCEWGLHNSFQACQTRTPTFPR